MFLIEMDPILPKRHLMSSGRYWSHIQDFQRYQTDLRYLFASSFPKSSKRWSYNRSWFPKLIFWKMIRGLFLNYLQATASAADLSSIRWIDVWMDFTGFLYISIDFHGIGWIFMYFGVWVPNWLNVGPAASIKTFARFQAGFLSSEDFHCLS